MFALFDISTIGHSKHPCRFKFSYDQKVINCYMLAIHHSINQRRLGRIRDPVLVQLDRMWTVALRLIGLYENIAFINPDDYVHVHLRVLHGIPHQDLSLLPFGSSPPHRREEFAIQRNLTMSFDTSIVSEFLGHDPFG
jgi:hypothetical protein